jgi:effector-binding domain-containing protein
MPVEAVKAVLDAPDLAERNALIVRHLERMESQLEHVQSTVSSLRMLLEPPPTQIAVEYRSVPRLRAASIANTVKLGEIEPWWLDAFAEIYRTLRAAGIRPTGPGGGLYPTELFTDEVGEAVVFVPIAPIADPLESSGRVRVIDLPAAELAVALHQGSHTGADRIYGALGTHVAERAIGVEGPIREHYLVTSDDTTDETQLRTEICWPVFRTVPHD